MEKEFTLSDMRSDDFIKAEDEVPATNGIKEVSIDEIRPRKEEVSESQKLAENLFAELDRAVERDMEKITELQNSVIDKEFMNQIDEDETKAEEEIHEELKIDDEEVMSLPANEEDFFKDLDKFENEKSDAAGELTEEETREQLDEIKASIKNKITPIVKSVDLSKFTISKKPVSISKLLSTTTPKAHIADWCLYSSKRPISISEFSGPEIEKLDPRNSSRNRLNTYKDIYGLIYKHVVDNNKPEFEPWLKTLKFFDINHIYFAIYKACFAGSNTIPYTCPNCNKMFMSDIDIDSMVKYADDDTKKEVERILSGDTTTISDEYTAELRQISDNYVVSLKDPTIYNVIFESASLSQEFTEKYKDLLGLISYIDEFYVINATEGTLDPVDTSPVPNDIAKSTMRKIKIYYEILSTLTSDQYYQLSSYIKDINDKSDKVSYIMPKIVCPKCGHEIPEEAKTPESLLFTRHQLGAIVNI